MFSLSQKYLNISLLLLLCLGYAADNFAEPSLARRAVQAVSKAVKSKWAVMQVKRAIHEETINGADCMVIAKYYRQKLAVKNINKNQVDSAKAMLAGCAKEIQVSENKIRELKQSISAHKWSTKLMPPYGSVYTAVYRTLLAIGVGVSGWFVVQEIKLEQKARKVEQEIKSGAFGVNFNASSRAGNSRNSSELVDNR